MKYAIAHAPIGTSFIIRAPEFAATSAMPEILRLSKDKDKEDILTAFQPEDTVYIEMGGATDQIALLALASGANVFSIPSFMLGDKDAVIEVLKVTDWALGEEKSRGNETGDKLTARRNRALALVVCAATNDPRLVPFRQDEWKILRVKLLYRSYRQDQKAFLVAFQQLLARLRLSYMLDAGDKVMEMQAKAPSRKTKAIGAKESLDMLLKTFSEEERAEFLQKVGIDDASLKTSVPRERVEDLFEKITERLMADDVTVSTVANSMKDTKKKIEATLDGVPAYAAVFEPIPGCGPLIAARMVANIGDIRRFNPHSNKVRTYETFQTEREGLRTACDFATWMDDHEVKRRIAKTTNADGEPIVLRGSLYVERREAQIIANVARERGDEQVASLANQIVANCESEMARRHMHRHQTSPASLKAFAGYHHFEDGSRACRKAGVVSNWAPELKQAVYLLCDQTLKRKDSPWRAKLDCRRAYELYKLLKDRQLKAFEQNLDIEILPAAYEKRNITSVLDMTVADLAVYADTGKRTKPNKLHPEGKPIMKLVGGLAFHVDKLREMAGIKANAPDEEDETAGAAEEEAEVEAKNPALAKLVKGLKKVALDKAMRWLGQQFLKHIFKEWRRSIGLVQEPVEPNAPALSDDAPKATPPATDHKPVSWESVPRQAPEA
ncbi:MAG: hypothetical protein WA001_03375 [Patescibacteria group bacterium]